MRAGRICRPSCKDKSSPGFGNTVFSFTLKPVWTAAWTSAASWAPGFDFDFLVAAGLVTPADFLDELFFIENYETFVRPLQYLCKLGFPYPATSLVATSSQQLQISLFTHALLRNHQCLETSLLVLMAE